MSDDLIRRSDAIEATIDYLDLLCKTKMCFHESGIDYNKEVAETIFEDVPSVEPKRGKWIDEADKYDASFGIHDYRCSNCNSYADEHIGGHEWYTMYKPNFCPHCGADMRGVRDDEMQ